MHYYKRNIGDYAKKAGRLTMLQHGAYTLLIDSCYDREKFPTLEEAIEWTWASTEAEVEAVKFVLSRFFKLDDDGQYVQDRILAELLDYHAKADKNKQIAIDRETKRREKSTNRAQPVNEAPPNHKPITNNQEPITKNHKPVTNNKNTSSYTADAAFDDFWNAYDKKVAKPAAEKAWKKIKPDDDLLITILQSARKYVQSTPNKQYRKDPATWLNNQCWNDEIVENIPQKTQTQLNNEALVRSLGLDKVYGKQTFIEEVQDVAAFTPRLG